MSPTLASAWPESPLPVEVNLIACASLPTLGDPLALSLNGPASAIRRSGTERQDTAFQRRATQLLMPALLRALPEPAQSGLSRRLQAAVRHAADLRVGSHYGVPAPP